MQLVCCLHIVFGSFLFTEICLPLERQGMLLPSGGLGPGTCAVN